MSTEELFPEGEKIRKAVKWISAVTQEHPERDRRSIVLEAEQRFDLSPKDCEFLNRHLVKMGMEPCDTGGPEQT